MRKLKAKQLVKDGWENIDSILYHQGLFYVLEIIEIELISKHYNNLLIGFFGIKKTCKFVA